MVSTDDITVVALVISLVALVLTLLSMAQSFLATADGYRRCAGSVTGVWSKFRHRHWNWYEFRFEVRFVTPQILLLSPAQLHEGQTDGLPTYVMNQHTLVEGTILHKTMHPVVSTIKSLDTSVLSPKRLGELESSIGSGMIKRQIRKLRGQHIIRQRPEREVLVSWLRLLQELHGLYYSYWPEDCVQCSEDRRNGRLDTGFTYSDSGLERSDHRLPEKADDTSSGVGGACNKPEDTSNMDRTDAVVVYRQWTWDFLPSDAVKPLAETTVGDLVILARRLGMQWRTLKLSEGVMQADGNGLVLSSTDVQNLGLVFKLGATTQPKPFPRIIPSVAADKLLCGILPGDPDLVFDDFDLVNNDRDRTLRKVDQPGGLFAQIGLAQVIIDKYKNAPLPEPANEAMILLLPFMPLPGSNIISFGIDGISPHRESIFLFWEGRYSLYRALETRVNENPTHKRMKVLKEVQEYFELLERKFPEDFYCKWEESAIRGFIKMDNGTFSDDITGKRKADLISTCRRIFGTTTKHFKDERLTKRFQGRSWYVLLVAAHVRMAMDVTKPIYDTNVKAGGDRDQQSLSAKYSKGFPHIDDSHRGSYINSATIEYVRGYAVDVENGLHHHDHGIAAFFSRRGIQFCKDPDENKDHCEALWWMLMIRGVAWTMSCRHEAVGPAVPPVFFGNKTPVWIT